MLLTKLANQEIFNFLRTVTIKNSYFADQCLKTLVNQTYQGILPKERNPYYMHLTGQYILAEDVKRTVSDPATGVRYQKTYKSSFDVRDSATGSLLHLNNKQVYASGAFDEMMYVTSLDTQETIPFTRENLHGDAANAASAVQHKKTLEAYMVPGRYFSMLCEQYPNQVDLIKSIVYLAPPREISAEEIADLGYTPSNDTLRMENVINAKHLELINCDSSILEPRERENMLDLIRATLDMIRTRWDIKEYCYEENYANVHWSMIWSLLPLIMIAQRYQNIKTANVHSSHVWDYLTSNGLDSYRGYLSSEQELFLYKNIRYLKDNSGQHKILNILIDNLLADYNLHIESKTVVLDTENILNDSTQTTEYSIQCESCGRKSICFKNIKDRKCDDWLGITTSYKPNVKILTEDLPGVRKYRVINLLMSRYGCTEDEATSRWDRSFMWRDQAIETIKAELDRDQTIDMGGTTEEFSDIFQREYDAELEPSISNAIIKTQRVDLQSINSTYLPTKLLEIVEDPVEPKYQDLFIKFLTDTMLHLSPYSSGGTVISRVNESYTVDIGKDAVKFIFNYGELVAALYLGFLNEFKANLKLDSIDSDGNVISQILTNFKDYKTYDFKIPNTANIDLTFKLGLPVKQQDLVDAFNSKDDEFGEKNGSYVEVEDRSPVYIKTTATVPDPSEKYYIKNSNNEYTLAGDDVDGKPSVFEEGVEYFYKPKENLFILEDGEYVSQGSMSVDDGNEDSVYYRFISMNDLVTNAPEGKELSLVKVGNYIYAVTAADVTSNDADWLTFDKVITIHGKFAPVFGTYKYFENNGEIAIIPKYFRWHYDHLSVRTFETYEDLLACKDTPEDYEVAAVWTTKELATPHAYVFDPTLISSDNPNGQWRLFTSNDANNSDHPITIDKVTYIKNCKRVTKNADGSTSTSTYSVTAVDMLNQNPELLEVDISDADPEAVFIDEEGLISSSEFTTYTKFETWFDGRKETLYSNSLLEHYIDVDYILDNLYVDLLSSTADQDYLGKYFANMFTIFERLDKIRASAGDIKTKIAVAEFFRAVMFSWKKHSFRLVQIEGLNSPTYTDWFSYDSEIGDAVSKLDNSVDCESYWNEFNVKLLSKLLEGCDLIYAKNTTDKTKYNKLKELVKSLSSYLIGFIGNNNNERKSEELPHVAEESLSHNIEFYSYMYFDVVGHTTNNIPIANVDEDIYIPATERFAVEGVDYYLNKRAISFRSGPNNGISELEDDDSYVKINIAPGTDIFHLNVYEVKTNSGYVNPVVYVKVNLHELLGLDEHQHIRAIYNNGWYYQVGEETEIISSIETYPADPEVTNVRDGKLLSSVTKMVGESENLGVKVCTKDVLKSTIVWNETLRTTEDFSHWMQLITKSYHIETSSDWSASGTNIQDGSEPYHLAELD